MFLRIAIGVVLAIIGAIVVIKTNKLYEWFGSIPWADRNLGSGGSRLMYRVIGVTISFIGFMYATNLWTAFLRATIGNWLNLNPKNDYEYYLEE